MVQLGAQLSPLGGTEYVSDLSIAGEVVEHRRRLSGTLSCCHRRRRRLGSRLDVQLVPLVEARRRGDHVGSILTAGDLIDGE